MHIFPNKSSRLLLNAILKVDVCINRLYENHVVAFPTDGIGFKGMFPFKLRKLGKGAGFDFTLAFVVGYDDSLW
jgi:hypothetical protein